MPRASFLQSPRNVRLETRSGSSLRNDLYSLVNLEVADLIKDDCPHISTRRYGLLARDRATANDLVASGYDTHSLRRSKAAEK